MLGAKSYQKWELWGQVFSWTWLRGTWSRLLSLRNDQKIRFYSVFCIRWSLWAYSAVVVLDDIEVCSNSQGGGGGGGGHIMKLLSLTFGKKFRTACHDVANIFQWQNLKATLTIDQFCPAMRSNTFFFELVLCDEVLTIGFVPINLQKFGREGIERRGLKF